MPQFSPPFYPYTINKNIYNTLTTTTHIFIPWHILVENLPVIHQSNGTHFWKFDNPWKSSWSLHWEVVNICIRRKWLPILTSKHLRVYIFLKINYKMHLHCSIYFKLIYLNKLGLSNAYHTTLPQTFFSRVKYCVGKYYSLAPYFYDIRLPKTTQDY